MNTFELGQTVTIIKSSTTGTIVGIATYTKGLQNMYLIEYVNGQGDLTQTWLFSADID